MDDLPELPFEKVLSYLSLEDLIKSRAVSKKFYVIINSFRVRSLCCSEWELDYTDEKHHIVDEFAQNFISSSKLELFFANFGRSILSGLKHLRICDLDVNGYGLQFALAVCSFEKLERLDFIRVENLGDFVLVLPNLKSIRFDCSHSAFALLVAPKLSEIRTWYCFPHLVIKNPESVETVAISRDDCLTSLHLEGPKRLEGFKNLKFLHCERFSSVSDTLLSSLEHLKEIRLDRDLDHLEQLHDQKRRYGRSELKIYYRGVCLASPRDYPFDSNTGYLSSEVLNFLIANYSRLADQVRFYQSIDYREFDTVSQVPTDFWDRLTRVVAITIFERVEDVEQFLNFWRNHPKVVRTLSFRCPQPQDLFDQLSAHRLASNIQCLLFEAHSDLDLTFLFKFEYLVKLWIEPIDVNFIPKIFKELKFLRNLTYEYEGLNGMIDVVRSRRFILINFTEQGEEKSEFDEIDEVVQAIQVREQQRRTNEV